MSDLLELPPPKYLGRRRQSTLEEIAAFKEKVSFGVKEENDDEEEECKKVEEPQKMGKGGYVRIGEGMTAQL